jgi:hypothetical protein
MGYVIRNLLKDPVDGVLGLVGNVLEGVSNANLCESLADAHAIARADGFKDGEYRIEPVYGSPQVIYCDVVGYAVMWDGAAIGANTNHGDISGINIVDVGRKFEDACKIVAGSELIGSGKLAIVPLFAGDPIK